MLYYALAAADAEILAIASSTVATLKDNVLGVISANIAAIVLVVATIFVITFLIRFFKRNVAGR